jgi:hypothetical protein
MLLAFESRDCSLSEIAPLVCIAQEDLRNLFHIFQTRSSRQVLQTTLSRFITQILTNNHQEAISVDCLTALDAKNNQRNR